VLLLQTYKTIIIEAKIGSLYEMFLVIKIMVTKMLLFLRAIMWIIISH